MRKGDRKLPDGMTMEMGARVSAWARQAYPRDTAKLLARDFGASPHTTKKWLSGCLPSNEHLAAMGRRWGKRFLAFVYEPVVGPWRHYAMDEELRDLKSRIAEIEREYADGSIDASPAPMAGNAADVALAPDAGQGPAAETATGPADDRAAPMSRRQRAA